MEVRYSPPPQKKGYLSDTDPIPYENKANGCDTPLCDTISKGYCAIGGGILRWAAKSVLLGISGPALRDLSGSPAAPRGKEFWKCTGGLKSLEL